MQLKMVHKIVIGAALGLGVIFAVYSASQSDWIMTGVSAGVTGALGVYLWKFVAKTRRRQRP